VSALARTSLPITIERTGLGFTIERLRDPRIPITDHVAAARRGLDIARRHLIGGKADLVILDEILGAVLADLIALDDVLELVRSRPPNVHLLLTGREAPAALIEIADLVSEVKLVRHPFERGIRAQRGIEF
jgi:cob(I)alamin adenosyltransferase